MNVQNFHEAFEQMRVANLGKQFERREIGLLALRYGIYVNSTMWVCGFGNLFKKGRVGTKFIYTFKRTSTTEQDFAELSTAITAYKRNTARTIEHAKNILRKYNIHNID